MKFTAPLSRTIHYVDLHPLGRQELPVYLFIHGAGGSHRVWRHQHSLSKHFRLILLDLPGHGDSPGPGEATIGRYADYIVDFIKSNRLEHVVPCGHSMGGAIALEVALREPGLLKGLVLVSTGAKLRVLPAIFTIIREDYPLAIQGMAGFVFGPNAPAQLVEEEKQQLARNSPDLMLMDFTACDSFDIMNKVDSIKLPSLVICGREDRLTSPKYSELLHSRIAGSRLLLFEDCGHMAMLELGDSFNKCFFEFAQRLQA